MALLVSVHSLRTVLLYAHAALLFSPSHFAADGVCAGRLMQLPSVFTFTPLLRCSRTAAALLDLRLVSRSKQPFSMPRSLASCNASAAASLHSELDALGFDSAAAERAPSHADERLRALLRRCNSGGQAEARS